MIGIEVAVSDEQIAACYPVMRELRPHIEARAFVQIVRAMQREGYCLAFATDRTVVVAVAGFRIKRTLFCDRFLYVDDLVTVSTKRSNGYGRILLEWLKERARAEGCAELHLDSANHRADAHRFYERNGVPASALHFRAEISARVPWSSQSAPV
jgi:GNAT superfamily N-acetyltransferase